MSFNVFFAISECIKFLLALCSHKYETKAIVLAVVVLVVNRTESV
jgi:hypothetical protein